VKRKYGRPKSRWNNNITTGRNEVGCENVKWINVAECSGGPRLLTTGNAPCSSSATVTVACYLLIRNLLPLPNTMVSSLGCTQVTSRHITTTHTHLLTARRSNRHCTKRLWTVCKSTASRRGQRHWTGGRWHHWSDRATAVTQQFELADCRRSARKPRMVRNALRPAVI
jgi:hypothetical protein